MLQHLWRHQWRLPFFRLLLHKGPKDDHIGYEAQHQPSKSDIPCELKMLIIDCLRCGSAPSMNYGVELIHRRKNLGLMSQ